MRLELEQLSAQPLELRGIGDCCIGRELDTLLDVGNADRPPSRDHEEARDQRPVRGCQLDTAITQPAGERLDPVPVGHTSSPGYHCP